MDFKGFRFPKEIILRSVRGYLRYGLSYRDLEEMLEARGVCLDPTTIFRGVLRFTPRLAAEARRRKKPVGGRWRMDETYLKVRGQDRSLYRAVDKTGDTVDFLFTARRDRNAARRFLEKAIRQNGRPSWINIDKSGANKAGIEDSNSAHGATPIEVRPCKYLNNLVEQDHRNLKRRVRPRLGFKSFRSARVVLGGIELVHMIRKGQVASAANRTALSPAETFYRLAA